MEISLPYNFKKNTMYKFVDSVIDENMNPKDQEFIFNFSNVKFIEPAGVAILSNVIEWLHRRKVKVIFSYPNNTHIAPTNVISYLDDSMFFNHYLGKCLTPHAGVRSTTVPLKLVAYDESVSWLKNNFLPWLSDRLSIPVSSLANIDSGFGEIFNNIRDHAEERIGCIYAQHYPGKDQIKICISDFGVGIPTTIRRVYPDCSDGDALRIAIKEGISSKSTPRNRGAGLKTLVHNIVLNYGGLVQIRSYSGILSLRQNDLGELGEHFEEANHKYPGTFIELTLDTTQFSELDEEEEFEWD